MATKVVELKPETPNAKYLRWVRVTISILSFGMVFPNAMTERMVKQDLPPYITNDGDKTLS